MKRWISVVAGVLLTPAMALASVQSGIDAYVNGNYPAAYEQWLPLAQQGDRDALHNLGILFLEGRGVEQNTGQAVSLLERAAELGSVSSALELAGLYEAGRLVPQDAAKAAEWYRQAAEAGSPLAQNNLGLLYLKGAGVERDIGEALSRFSRASSAGVAVATENLEAVLARLVVKQIKVRGANVREGGSTDFPVIEWAGQGEQVHVIGEVDGWSHVYVDDDRAVGWVASRLLQAADPS